MRRRIAVYLILVSLIFSPSRQSFGVAGVAIATVNIVAGGIVAMLGLAGGLSSGLVALQRRSHSNGPWEDTDTALMVGTLIGLLVLPSDGSAPEFLELSEESSADLSEEQEDRYLELLPGLNSSVRKIHQQISDRISASGNVPVTINESETLWQQAASDLDLEESDLEILRQVIKNGSSN